MKPSPRRDLVTLALVLVGAAALLVATWRWSPIALRRDLDELRRQVDALPTVTTDGAGVQVRRVR